MLPIKIMCQDYKCPHRMALKEFALARKMINVETNCTKYQSMETIQNCPYLKDKNKQLINKENKTMNNTYTFRGPINFYHLINDCIADNKISFLAISDNSVFFGVSKQVYPSTLDKYKNYVKPRTLKLPYAFTIYEIERRHIAFTMNFMKKLPVLMKKNIRDTTKILTKDKKKGKFSNKVKTKVIVS